jgi:hypothetical protein
MVDCFIEIGSGGELSPSAVQKLCDDGFVVLQGLVGAERLTQLSGAYDAAVASATGDDVRIGSACTRVNDFVNRGAEFDDIYILPSLLEAASHLIGRPFKLSSFLARTVQPSSPEQNLHVDVPRSSADWPLLGFILMIDEFRPDNAATRFVPGSHLWSGIPEDPISDLGQDLSGQVLACGAAGSLLVFHGSTWHGHASNTSSGPRRSLQGAFIPRGGKAATDFAARMKPETGARLGPLARCVLAL